MPRQFVVTLPGKGSTETADNPVEAADLVIDTENCRDLDEVITQLDTLKPGDTIFLASGTLVDVVGILDVEEPELDDLDKEYYTKPTGK